MNLSDGVDTLKGVGPKTATLFEKLHVHSIEDLLRLYPRNYLCYDEPVAIDEVQPGERVAIKANIQSYVDCRKIRHLVLVTCMVKDGSGSVKLVWYNSPFLKKLFHIGQTYVFVGTVTERNRQLEMEHPEYYTLQQYEQMRTTLWPVYPLTEGLSNKMVVKALKQALTAAYQMPDPIPEPIREEEGLMSLWEAVKGVHFPESKEQLLSCHNRLVYEEFFLFLVRMHRMREHTVRVENTYPIRDWTAVEHYRERLPFTLTKGQETAWEEIKSDLSGNTVMNRLVQGDVGSGKTVVAELALLGVASNGYQAAFMAPTEVLAMQHFKTIQKELEPYGVRVELLCGSMKLSEKRKIYEQLRQGEIDILVGTHALIQDKVEYKNLALVITDEQHRFGVRQRQKLSEKGKEPHVLVMSATPIPRTLAIILYGDLDISLIKDMPASRKPIRNCVVGPKYRPTAYRFMEEQIRDGHQVYIICPMVESSETVEAENVVEYSERLRDIFPDTITIACLHGRMTPDEKNAIMEEFAENRIQILVSTTVIEVGINNPNATVMMIENAEKFGLAQLHQLRGRVGRGQAQSYCIMLCASDRKEAQDRLAILNASNDGFYIANEDLKLRGPGDFFGIRQSGEAMFMLGDIYRDAEVLKKASDMINRLEKKEYDFTAVSIGERYQNIQL